MYPYKLSTLRQDLIVEWLESIRNEASAIYLLGDIFDFWFEYRYNIPKGYTRFLGKICELSDQGIEIHIFAGNHDTWLFQYFEHEVRGHIHLESYEFEYQGSRFFLAHGDGVGRMTPMYKFMRTGFRNHIIQRIFACLHPTILTWFGRWWSKHNLIARHGVKHRYIDPEHEPSILFAREYVKDHDIRYFIFGHRHVMLDMEITPSCRYINLGDWITMNSYAVFDGKELRMAQYKPLQPEEANEVSYFYQNKA